MSNTPKNTINVSSISDFRKHLSAKSDMVMKHKAKEIITIHNKPRMILMNLEDYEDEIEELSPLQWKEIEEARKEIANGEFVTLEQVLNRLNMDDKG